MNIIINTIGYILTVTGALAFLWMIPKILFWFFTVDMNQPYEITDDDDIDDCDTDEPIGAWVEVVDMDGERMGARYDRYISFGQPFHEDVYFYDFDIYGVPDEKIYYYLESEHIDTLTGTQLCDNEFIHGIYRWVYSPEHQ